ncbi:MAG: ImmA/IrrE family metallo-endopeptidase [Deltaproteobacteria bacterium]|nr:ImmA/IrrE family metallo-endopeptidase [Deltaproteobacteria bacterium]
MPSKRAASIIQDRRIRYPSEIFVRDIAMSLGALVRERELQGCEARLVRKGDIGIISVNSLIPEEGRKRFAIAHEIGHFMLHTGTQLILCSEDDMHVWKENKAQEMEANEFAASLLMPYEIFIKFMKIGQPTLDIISEIAKRFRTTLTATALRYVGISKEPCALVVSNDGIIRWYKKSDSFNFHVKVREKLSFDTHAFDFFDGVSLPEKPDSVPARAWLAGEIDEEAELFEQSLSLGSYGVVLSLLWICDDVKTTYRRYDDEPEEPEFDLTNPFTPDGKRWQW